jgi:hypothetical protein
MHDVTKVIALFEHDDHVVRLAQLAALDATASSTGCTSEENWQ